MGTETLTIGMKYPLHRYNVKLNNPLLGTETLQISWLIPPYA